MPAPSPTTNPSRPESHGRLACAGSSLRVERLHGGKSPNAHGRDGGFGAAANHHFCCAALDDLEGITNGMGGSGTRRGRRGVRPARAITNRNLPGSQINDGGRNEKGRNLVGTAVQQLPVLALDDVEPTDAGRNVNADLVEIRILRLPVG